jgi:hypothetical protein
LSSEHFDCAFLGSVPNVAGLLSKVTISNVSKLYEGRLEKEVPNGSVENLCSRLFSCPGFLVGFEY